ncbi:hypothetical protein HWV62_23290 [Athelia sp. TMB]|nr:hypothetical protein HWV62_23290 [Athelia sp. TMB]
MSSNVQISQQSDATAPTPQNTPLNQAPIALGLSRPTVPDITEDNEAEDEEDTTNALDSAGIQAAMLGMVQGRLAGLVGKSSGYIEALPAGVKRNVEALKGVQVKQTELQNQYKRECLELEKKYLELQKPLYERRHAIITGSKPATEEEVAAGEAQSLKDDPEHTPLPAGTASDPSGIPEFWLTALRNHIGLSEIITERDAGALKHLLDIQISYLGKEEPKPGFKLTFIFSPNEFFENETLEKTYVYQEEVGYGGDFVYDRAIGTPIKWKEEKDLTKEFEIKKQRNKNTNRTRLVRKAKPTESFFNFFTPPPPIEEDSEIDEDELEEIEEKLEIDYQIGEDLKEKIIPRAVDYFTGKALEYEAMDDDEDDYEDLDDDDDEDAFEEDSDSEEELPARRRGPPRRAPLAGSAGSNVNPEECKQQGHVGGPPSLASSRLALGFLAHFLPWTRSSTMANVDPAEQISQGGVGVDSLTEEDVIIAVMGPTGAGKSSFISKAIGGDQETIGHGLESHTRNIRAVRCRHPHDSRSYVFVDTPGFDDTNLSDVDILIEISSWLNATYKRRINITAILYLHRISDNRMTGSALRNMDLFQKLCGNRAARNVILVTTMWDEVDEEVGERREAELRDTFWRTMVAHGSQTVRFSHTPESAWNILGSSTGHFRPMKLQIQEEMVDKGISLSKTAAGSFLNSWLTVLSKQFKIFFAWFRKAILSSKLPENDERLEDLQRRKASAELNIEKVQIQVKLLDDRSSVHSDTSSVMTAKFKTAPSSPINQSPPTVSRRASIASTFSRAAKSSALDRKEAIMWAKYGTIPFPKGLSLYTSMPKYSYTYLETPTTSSPSSDCPSLFRFDSSTSGKPQLSVSPDTPAVSATDTVPDADTDAVPSIATRALLLISSVGDLAFEVANLIDRKIRESMGQLFETTDTLD